MGGWTNNWWWNGKFRALTDRKLVAPGKTRLKRLFSQKPRDPRPVGFQETALLHYWNSYFITLKMQRRLIGLLLKNLKRGRSAAFYASVLLFLLKPPITMLTYYWLELWVVFVTYSTYSTYTGVVKMKLQSGKIDVTSTNDEIYQFCKKIVIVKLM
jgi:hypothetical protein